MYTTLISHQQSLVYGIAGAAIGLTTILLIIHIVLRRLARTFVWWDDGFFWLGGCLALATNASIIYSTYLNLVRGSDQILLPQSVEYLQSLFAINLLRLWSIALVKASLLLFSLRLFRSNKPLRWIAYFSLCLLIIWVTTFSFVSIFQCQPISYFWKQSLPEGSCVTDNTVIKTAFLISDAVLNILTDILCLLAPWPVLRRLHLEASKKTCLGIIYVLGTCKIITVILYLIYQIKTLSSNNYSQSQTTLLSILLLLEVNLAVTCSCLPSLTTFNARIFFLTPNNADNPHQQSSSSSSVSSIINNYLPAHYPASTFEEEEPLKLQPYAECPILTTVTSRLSSKEDEGEGYFDEARLGLELDGYCGRERYIEELGPDEIMVKFRVLQTVENV